MCGIAGAFDPGRATDALDLASQVASMIALLAHRGPDGAGFLAEGSGTLAHRRLAIHDRSDAGLQPMTTPDGDVLMVMNGTIQNAPDLRARERIMGYEFQSGSDSEVVLPLYRRLGPGFVGELRGPFALAIIDRKERRLLLARDRLGKKPLFYARSGAALLFASETAALLPVLPSRRYDRDAATAYLQAGYVPAPATVVEEIRNLEPASLLVFDAAGLRTERYWNPPSEAGGDPRRRNTVELFAEVMKEAVFLRTRTERRLGILLSGGLDSATVLALAQEAAGRPLPSFTLGFEDPRRDERGPAAVTARALGSPHHAFVFDREPGPYLQDLVATTGELLADASWLPTSFVCEKAAPTATVLLAGDGGDETLLGYRRHAAARLSGRIRSRLLRAWLAAVAPLLPRAGLRKAAHAMARGRKGALSDLAGLLPSASLAGVLEIGRSPPDRLTSVYAGIAAPRDGAAAAGLWDLLTYLPGDLLPKIDRGSMRHGVEVWSPFLDHVVVETLLRLPGEERMRLLRGKLPLRRWLRERLPPSVIRRRKRGFAVPLVAWLRRGSYGAFAREVLGDVRAPFEGVLSGGSALPLLRRCREGEDDLAPLVHACVVLALFHERFLR